MKLLGIMPARNESWVIGASLRAALLWCDEVIILNHASMDNTADIAFDVADENPGRVHVLLETCLDWPEMAHRQRLLTAARGRRATHVAIVDADEILAGYLLPTSPDADNGIRAQILQLPPGSTLQVPMPCMWRSLDDYRVGNSVWASGGERDRCDLTLAFADRTDLNWAPKNGYDHHCREPLGSRVGLRSYGMAGGVMHLQFAPWRRLVAKHGLYKMSERIKYPAKPVAEIDRMYSLALDETGLQLRRAPMEWWHAYQDIREYIDLNAEPWQEQECKRLWMQHGAAAFSGLNLFGVVGEPVAA